MRSSLNKYLIVGMAAVVVVPSSWLIRSIDAEDNVTLNQKCLDDAAMLINNPELAAAVGSYKCGFTGEKCTADYHGKQDEFIKICCKIGGVPYEVDMVLDCVGPTNVKTIVAFDNDGYCVGTNCTTTEISVIARLLILDSLAGTDQICSAAANNPVISEAATTATTSDAAAPHGRNHPFSGMGRVAWIGSHVVATLLATIAFIVM